MINLVFDISDLYCINKSSVGLSEVYIQLSELTQEKSSNENWKIIAKHTKISEEIIEIISNFLPKFFFILHSTYFSRLKT